MFLVNTHGLSYMDLEIGSYQLIFSNSFLKFAMFICQLNNIFVDGIVFNLEHEDKCE